MAARIRSKHQPKGARRSVRPQSAAPRFRRVSRQVRREELIDATLRSITRLGHAGLSVRHISAEAGVSIGLINHHFPSKDDLVAAAYEALANAVRSAIADEVAGGENARERLRRFFHASFSPRLLDRRLFDVWLVFWSMAAHAPAIRAAHDRTYSSYRALLQELLGALATEGEAPAFAARPAAIALSALLDGLWVELSLNPRTFGAKDAVALCEDWVAALCAGAFPRLRGGAATARRPRYTTVQQGRGEDPQ